MSDSEHTPLMFIVQVSKNILPLHVYLSCPDKREICLTLSQMIYQETLRSPYLYLVCLTLSQI